MSLEPRRYAWALGALLLSLSMMGCDRDDGGSPAAGQDMTADMAEGADMVVTPSEPVSAPSARPRVKEKGPTRWGADLGRGLDLSLSELCREFGEFDCLQRVHLIALGGTEPYVLGIDEPLDIAPVTGAIAADRVALSACGERARRDLDDLSSAALFKELEPGGARPTDEALDVMSGRLYERLLSRRATKEERDHLAAFWDEVDGARAGDGEDTSLLWAQLSCYAVATSMESLFY